MIKEFYNKKSIIEYSDKLADLKKVLYDTPFNEPGCFNNPLRLVHLWLKERGIFLRKIPFTTFEEFEKISNSKKLLNDLNDCILYKLPTEIPILRVSENKDYGCFTPIYFEMSKEVYSLFFTEFRLSRINSVFTPIVYTHELIHTIIENNDKSITDYIDYELMPIFFEFLLACDLGKNIFDYIIYYRFNKILEYNEMLREKDYLIKIYSSSYINSTLLAYEMINLYINTNETLRKEFIQDLIGVLKEQNDVNYVLDKYNIEYSLTLDKICKRRRIM